MNDGTLKRVLTPQERFKPQAHHALTIGKDTKPSGKDPYASLPREKLRKELERDTAAYLASGKTITQIPFGVCKHNEENWSDE